METVIANMADKTKGDDSKDKDDNLNDIWNVVYKLQAALGPIMPSDRKTDTLCPKSDTDSCPSGHMMVSCGPGEGYTCQQCGPNTFQPNENWLNDRCRLRQQCLKANMRFADFGSTIRDAVCACEDGYHFPNEDQRACLPNSICGKGTAPNMFGICESCLRKSMYSDTVGRANKCKPLTNCEKQSRCTLVRSNGEMDNVCGPVVSDLNMCEESMPASSSTSNTTTYAIAAGVGGAVLLIIILLVFFFFRRRRDLRRRRDHQRPLTEGEMEMLRLKIVKESDRDPALCKKVISTSFSFIEERIDRQIWTLAQELFRSHPKQGHFELIVDKYKESQAKYTVNGYLQEWKLWRGENKESVAELFRCLRQVKRDDIVNEICMCLRNDVDFQSDSECQVGYSANKPSLKDDCLYIFFPCFCHKHEKSGSSAPDAVVVETEGGEAGTKLLAIATDDLEDGADSGVGGNGVAIPPGTFYRAHPSPSAPELDEGNSGCPSMENVKYSRQFSQPVQATS